MKRTAAQRRASARKAAATRKANALAMDKPAQNLPEETPDDAPIRSHPPKCVSCDKEVGEDGWFLCLPGLPDDLDPSRIYCSGCALCAMKANPTSWVKTIDQLAAQIMEESL